MDKIAIESAITCVIYSDMPRKMLAKKKDSASESEVDSEPVSELSSDERGGVNM